MTDDELRKQAHRERTRMAKLRYGDDEPVVEINKGVNWLPYFFIALGFLLLGRMVMNVQKSIPQNALETVKQDNAQAAPAATAPAEEPIYQEQEHVTDEHVQRMLSQMNGNQAQGPAPVSAVAPGSYNNFDGAATPELIKVRGKWFRKAPDNIYKVNGEEIYYENKRKRQ